MPPMPVQLLTLEARPIEQAGEFIGTIKSRRSTTIQPQAEGFLTRILVTPGARVTPGTPLFEVDAATQTAVVSSLEAQRASREADLAYARQQADRARLLLDAGASSRQEYEWSTTQVKTAEAQLKSIDDQIRQQQAELSYYRVVAQTSGTVGDIPVRVGERVTRTTVLTTIDDNAGLEVYVSVPVQQAPRLSLGLPVRVVDHAGTTIVSSRVSFVAASVDDATQTVLVKAGVPAGAKDLRADQFVRVRVIWATEPGLTIPVVAVQRVNSQHFVFVAEEASGGLVARQRQVSLGPVLGDAYLAIAGVSAGDLIVLAGTQKIGEGAPIQALPPGGAPPSGAGPGPGGAGGD
jgi:RND family efflux transporter MFP subunit